MIQRIQSLYLLFILVFMVTMFFVPLVSFEDASGALYNYFAHGLYRVTVDGQIIVHNNYVVMTLVSLIIVVTLVTVFSYKNRTRQLVFCKYLVAAIAALAVFVSFEMIVAYSGNQYSSVTFQKSIILPFISFLPVFMAIRGIKKDEELVKSADRLR